MEYLKYVFWLIIVVPFSIMVKHFVSELIKEKYSSIKDFLVDAISNPTFTFSLSLDEAAQFAYEALENSYVRDFVDRMNKDHIYGFFIQDMLQQQVIFYGKHPPSNKYEAIPTAILKRECFTKVHDYNLCPKHTLQPTYINIRIGRRHFKKYIKARQKDYQQFDVSSC